MRVNASMYVALALIGVMAISTPVQAEWSCNDTINTAVSVAPNLQEDPIMVSDLDGGAIIFWKHVRLDYSARDIYAQRLRSSGEIYWSWPTPGLPVLTTGDNPVHITAISDNAGGAYVAWDDAFSGTSTVYVQHVLATGAVDPLWPTAGVVPVATSDYQAGPILVSDGALGVIVIWGQFPVGVLADIRAQHIFNSGVVDTSWPVDGLGVCTESGEQWPSSAIPAGEGGVLLVWGDGRLNPNNDSPEGGDLAGNSTLAVGDNDIFAHHILGNGEMDPGWPVNGNRICFATGNQLYPELMSDGSGGGIVAWTDNRAGGWDYDIYAHHFFFDGSVDQAWPEDGLAVCVKPGRQQFPRLVTDGAGGALIAWTDSTGSNPFDIFAQHVLANGSVDGGWPAGGLEICGAPGDQYAYPIVSDGQGGALLTWEDPRGPYNDVYAQRILTSGIAPGWPADGLAVCTTWQRQGAPSLVMSEEGTAIVTWHDRRADPTDDIYAQRISLRGSLDDPWEENDNCSSPVTIPWGGYQGMIVSNGDSDWYRITVPRGTEMVIDVHYDHPDGDIDVALYDSMCGATPVRLSEETTGQEIFGYFNPGPTMDMFLHVYLYPGASTCNDYSLLVDPMGVADLEVMSTPAGWVAPVVPRNEGGASIGSVPLTPTLDGNVPTTYLNWSAYSSGGSLLPEWSSSVEVDNELLTAAWIPDADPLGWKWVINAGPHVVRGGRHTIAVVADRELQVPETNESNNSWAHQLIWSPLDLTFETPMVRSVPPWRGEGTYLNADGMAFTRQSAEAWVTSIASLHEADDYDLFVYDDYTGSTAGFSNQIGYSNLAFNYTEFVVGHGASTPTTVYPAVSRWQAGIGSEFFIDQSDTRNRWSRFDTNPNKLWLEEQLASGRLANVYNAGMFAGNTYVFTLLSPDPSLRFELFPSQITGVHARGDGEPGLLHSPNMRMLVFNCTVQGFYPIVVYRDNGISAEDPTGYEFHWYTGVTEVPEPPAPSYTLTFQGSWPNPMTGESRIVFTLSRPGPVRLQVFDVRGRLVGTLLDGPMVAGPHSEAWDGRSRHGKLLGAGIYWLRFQAEDQEFVKRVVLLN